MGRIPTAFSCSKELLDKIDARARSLEMNRSQYIIQVLRKDLSGSMSELSIVAEESAEYQIKKRK